MLKQLLVFLNIFDYQNALNTSSTWIIIKKNFQPDVVYVVLIKPEGNTLNNTVEPIIVKEIQKVLVALLFC